jgi:hypothetical protein
MADKLQSEKDSSRQPVKEPQVSRRTRPEQETERIFMLETENEQLKKELADATETIGILKHIIAEPPNQPKPKKTKN